MVEISREERDAYLIPQNFVDTGTILGGTVKLRNAVEAAVLAVGSAIPLFYLPMAFNIRLMIVIAVSVPLGVFGVVGIGGDSLTQFVAHWFRFMKRRRIVTPTPQGNLEANRHRHLRLISKRYRVVYYDDSNTLPHNAQVLQRKADRHGKLVKRQTLYDLLPIEKIENGILHTTDDRYIKILEIEPINFLLRSPREQRSVIYSFASLLKVSPVRLQFKSFSRKADVNAYLDKLRRDAANEPDAAVRKRHMSYIRFVKRLGSRDAVSRRFFVIFQYEAPTNERNISYAEIVSTLETTARNFRTYLAQCGNAIVEHENEDEFITDVFYTLLNRRTAVQVPLQERIQDVLASYLAQNDATALDKIPPAAFMIPPSLDLKHGRYLYMDGIYHAYLMIPADGYRAQVIAGWMALLVNAGDGIDVDLFLERQPKERMMQKIGQQIRINRSKIKDTSDTNSDFDDLSNAIRSGYYLKDGLANNEDFYYAAILVTVTAASVKDLEWRIGEIRKLMVSQDMNLQLCSFRQEAAFLSSLPLCAPDTALFKKYRRNILTSTAASFYPFVSFELCDTNGVLLGVNKYNNSLVSLDNFNTRIYKNANMAILGTSGAGKTFTMQNDRVLGSITLSKVDLDAARYLVAGSNGDSTLEGAVYDLYAAEDIHHPDGVSGIVDYSKITDASGTPIWHTTVLTNGAWKSDYLPVLKKDHLVASAAINDGKLAFSNLYLGRYYLVERATGIVIPMDSNEQYYLSGQYPLLNKKLEPTGSYAALASNGAEYTDYVYRNQYSAVAESRALDGSKTYDGYYLSFAKGYLCDEVNHYQSLTYADESTYVIRAGDETQDEVLKSGFSLQKLVSTTGQPSTAIKLGGAGFKVYRISLLSKADQFTQNTDGSYDAASILDAYRKSSYDQDTLKFDFSAEEQAVATMYESDTAAVNRYNATLTADGDFANGQGLGWVPTNNAQEYRLSEIFTNEEGILRVQELPYGQYIVMETTVPKDVFQAEPFLVTVNASSPQSSFTVPAGSITTPSGSYMTYNILDEELEGYLQLVKIDIETGKPVKIADTAFNLYYIAEDGRETLVEMNDPKSGNAWAKTSTFYTDSNGEMKTPEKLPLGKYRIVEVEGPHGYFNDRQYNVVFELTSDRVYQVSGGSADGMDDYVITENYYNHETLGQIKIRKIGNVLTGYENGQFVYETDNLANATYEIHAQGDIPTPDNQGTLWYADGDLVATVTTAEDGQVDEVQFSPTRTTATYDFLKVTHDGTKGEVAITLPLGTYTISEVQAPYGYVHTDHTYTVVLDWDNQYNDLVLAKTIIDHTQDGDVVYNYSIINAGNASAEQIEKQVLVFENSRVLPVVEEGKVGVGLYKLDRDTCDLTDEKPYADGCKTRASLLNGSSNRADIPADAKMVAGAVYELYTADDIYSISGELLAAADTLLGTATTDENGLAYFDVDVPLRGEHYGSSDAHDWTTNSGRYYLREVSVPDGYLIEQSVIPVEFTYENQFIACQIVDCLHSDKQTTVEIDKRAFTADSNDTFALPGATLTVTDWNGNVVDSWECGDTAHVIRELHLSHDFAGNRDTTKIYTLTETRPADGYVTARSIQFRLEQATDDNGYLQETAVWVLRESEDSEYQSGSIISPTAFSDDTVATIPAKLRAFWDNLMGKNPDADGVVIANWYCVNGTLVVNFTDAANDRAFAKCLRESDFSDLTFDTVYLNGAAAPAFFADKQVAEKPADAEITYSASWILLKDSDGFSQTVTMLDAPTHVKISKADITTHEEIPGATLRVLDKGGNVVDEWVSEDTPHYMEAVLVAGETYMLEETLVPDNSGYVPANSIQFTVEDDGKVQHVFMQDDYTKVQISKTDIATGTEISGAKPKITDADGKTVAEWVTDGTPHYMERIPMGTYTLTETMAPTEQGYVRAESVTFEVGPTGDIQRVEMKDDFTKVEISKADMTDGRELPGAKLKITDANGSSIAEWETNGQPHRIERLKPGEYTLTETAAPAGYLLSEEVRFTVQETGEIQKVTMYDAPAHSLIFTKRDIATNAKLVDARLTIRDAYGTTIDRWTTTDGDHAIRVLPERSAAKDPRKNLLLLSDDTSEHVYTMVEELAPDGYLVAESITFKVMQMNDALVVFVWQDGGWQKSSEGYLAMYDERTNTPMPLMKTFPQTGSIS